MIYLLILAWAIPGTIIWAMINLNQKKPSRLDGVRTAVVYSGRAAPGIGAFSREPNGSKVFYL